MYGQILPIIEDSFWSRIEILDKYHKTGAFSVIGTFSLLFSPFTFKFWFSGGGGT